MFKCIAQMRGQNIGSTTFKIDTVSRGLRHTVDQHILSGNAKRSARSYANYCKGQCRYIRRNGNALVVHFINVLPTRILSEVSESTPGLDKALQAKFAMNKLFNSYCGMPDTETGLHGTVRSEKSIIPTTIDNANNAMSVFDRSKSLNSGIKGTLR